MENELPRHDTWQLALPSGALVTAVAAPPTVSRHLRGFAAVLSDGRGISWGDQLSGWDIEEKPCKTKQNQARTGRI